MRYELGTKVRIKSFDWYNKNKDKDGFVRCGDRIFDDYMSVFCGSIVTIRGMYHDRGYDIQEDMQCRTWTDEMIEGPAWNDNVWGDVIETLDELARVRDELKNCTKGTYTHCKTDEQLVNCIQELAERLEKQLVC